MGLYSWQSLQRSSRISTKVWWKNTSESTGCLQSSCRLETWELLAKPMTFGASAVRYMRCWLEVHLGRRSRPKWVCSWGSTLQTDHRGFRRRCPRSCGTSLGFVFKSSPRIEQRLTTSCSTVSFRGLTSQLSVRRSRTTDRASLKVITLVMVRLWRSLNWIHKVKLANLRVINWAKSSTMWSERDLPWVVAMVRSQCIWPAFKATESTSRPWVNKTKRNLLILSSKRSTYESKSLRS